METRIKIKGMHCKSCAQIIEDKLGRLDGVEAVSVDFASEEAKVSFDQDKIALQEIEREISAAGYRPGSAGGGQPTAAEKKKPFKEALVYGLAPHIGCIGFLAASVLGVTFAVELFKPLLLNPWFFHFLILLSLLFATASSAFYLKKNGLLSWKGVKRKKGYLATMYGVTMAVNIFLFFVIFPLTANFSLDPAGQNAFGSPGTGLVAASGSPGQTSNQSKLRLQVDIPCPGHAPLISGELKTIDGVNGVAFSFPNYFDISLDPSKTSEKEILALDVFKTYPATVIGQPPTGSADFSGVQASEPLTPQTSPAPSGCGCGGI